MREVLADWAGRMFGQGRGVRAPAAATRWKKLLFVSSAPLLVLTSVASPACSQDPSIRAEVSVVRSSVNNGEAFSASTTIRNVGSGSRSLQVWSCSYPDQWTSDNPVVHVRAVPCKKNVIVRIELKPGETYARDLSLLAKIGGTGSSPEVVRFRLGFSSDVSDEKKPPRLRIWSNVITIDVAP